MIPVPAVLTGIPAKGDSDIKHDNDRCTIFRTSDDENEQDEFPISQFKKTILPFLPKHISLDDTATDRIIDRICGGGVRRKMLLILYMNFIGFS